MLFLHKHYSNHFSCFAIVGILKFFYVARISKISCQISTVVGFKMRYSLKKCRLLKIIITVALVAVLLCLHSYNVPQVSQS